MSAIATSDTVCSGHGGAFPSHTDGNSAHPGSAVSTRSWFAIGGKGVVCVGDPLSCGSVIANGEAIFQVS